MYSKLYINCLFSFLSYCCVKLFRLITLFPSYRPIFIRLNRVVCMLQSFISINLYMIKRWQICYLFRNFLLLSKVCNAIWVRYWVTLNWKIFGTTRTEILVRNGHVLFISGIVQGLKPDLFCSHIIQVIKQEKYDREKNNIRVNFNICILTIRG